MINSAIEHGVSAMRWLISFCDGYLPPQFRPPRNFRLGRRCIGGSAASCGAC
jgi:hypothetical protein